MADDPYLGEFRRGPAIFTVFALDNTGRIRVDCSDGNGPSEVCAITPGEPTRWRGAWNGDEWCAWIEVETRRITHGTATEKT